MVWLKVSVSQELFVPGHRITKVALKATPKSLLEEQLGQKYGQGIQLKGSPGAKMLLLPGVG